VNVLPGSSTDLHDRQRGEADSPASWRRLCFAIAVGIIGSVGMWSVPISLPFVQADFGITRAGAALPFTLAMTGFALGGVAMGWLCDRFGVAAAILLGSVALGLGYAGASVVATASAFGLVHLLIGFGASATFGPLMADMSRWFVRHRGIAVSIAASGNYMGGVVWPPLLQHAMAADGWRHTYLGVGIGCVLAALPFIVALRRRAPSHSVASTLETASSPPNLGISGNAVMVLLFVAGVACCVAMAMPQVHIVAYCGDLGYGPARGAEMLSAMLGFGVVSRIGSGFVADRLGGVTTLLIGAVLQGTALVLYLLFDGLISLYIISALFGLFQGGIVPMYAIIVRQYFPPNEVGIRIGIVLMATLLGMALGGWMAGIIFDQAGSYQAAFLNGLMWNALNVAIVLWLKLRPVRSLPAPA